MHTIKHPILLKIKRISPIAVRSHDNLFMLKQGKITNREFIKVMNIVTPVEQQVYMNQKTPEMIQEFS